MVFYYYNLKIYIHVYAPDRSCLMKTKRWFPWRSWHREKGTIFNDGRRLNIRGVSNGDSFRAPPTNQVRRTPHPHAEESCNRQSSSPRQHEMPSNMEWQEHRSAELCIFPVTSSQHTKHTTAQRRFSEQLPATAVAAPIVPSPPKLCSPLLRTFDEG